MQVRFQIVRQTENTLPQLQTYDLDVDPGITILDCLNRIKWEQDGTLAFRKNCRNTICGSCSMRINGRSALACKESVGSEAKRLQAIAAQSAATATANAHAVNGLMNGAVNGVANPTAIESPANSVSAAAASTDIVTFTIAPMGNMPVVKDLVVDMSSFWDNLEAVDPYVSTKARALPEREFLQSPEERDRLNQVGNCILCGACYSECAAREVNPDFVGPHALAKAYRTIADSRDSQTEERLETYNEGTKGVWGCTRCYYCNAVCPMEVSPLDQISKIKQEILDRKDAQASRSIRHRKVLVELVKQGGWIDERKFGVRVVGNNLRDLGGVLSLGPLGLRLLVRGKFPFTFEPSEGVAEVRSLIEAVQSLEATAQNSNAL